MSQDVEGLNAVNGDGAAVPSYAQHLASCLEHQL